MLTQPTTAASLELVLAAQGGDIDLVKRKIADGAPIEGLGLGGMTALFVASSRGDVPMVDCLLNAGANPNHILDEIISTDEVKRKTALNAAIGAGSVDAIDLLLSRGANPLLVDRLRSPPLTQLIQDHRKILAQLSGQQKLDDTVVRLLDAGARINQASEVGQTPLERALCVRAPVTTITQLLDRGADIGRYNEFGKHLVHLAASSGQVDHLRLLAGRGADIKAVDNLERTALWGFTSVDAGLALIDLGVDINWQDMTGRTALGSLLDDSLAQDEITPEIALLIDEGSALDLPDFRGNTVRDICRRRGFNTILAFAAAAGARKAMRSVEPAWPRKNLAQGHELAPARRHR
jgi:ankyrin repeat protein